MESNVNVAKNKRRIISWRPASKQDVKSDFNVFLDLHNFDLKNKKGILNMSDIDKFGVSLYPLSMYPIKKTKFTNLSNSIVFFSNSKNDEVRELVRHFKNLVSHPQNIKKGNIDGIPYYRIYDYYVVDKTKSVKRETMKGVVSVDVWRDFAKQLENKIKQTINNN